MAAARRRHGRWRRRLPARATQSHQGRLRVGWRIGWRHEAAAASCGVSGSRDCGGNHDGDSWRS